MTNVRLVSGRATTHDNTPHDMASEALHFSDDWLADYGELPTDDKHPKIPELSHAGRIALASILDAGFADAVRERQVAGRNGIFVLHAPNGWRSAVNAAANAAAGDLCGGAKTYHLSAVKSLIDSVLSHATFRDSHVVIVSEPDDDPLPDDLLGFATANIDLTRIESRLIEREVRAVYGNRIDWPRDLSSKRFPARFLDYAIGFGRDFEACIRLLRLQIRERDRRRREAEKASEDRDAEERDKQTRRGQVVVEVLRPTTPTIEQLHGYGAFAEWVRDVALDFGMYKEGRLDWSEIDPAALLVGPPGTGKTLAAQALAASLGVPLIATSYAQWQSTGDGHLGYVIKAIRAVFARAREVGPAVLFIDEIDVVCARGSGSGRDDWWTAIVACLLECLDGILRERGIITIAACNHGNLDPALVRSGRIEKRFDIRLPNEAALLGIFGHHLADLDAGTIAPIATALAGTISGADVARIAREARRAGRRAGRDRPTAADLFAVALPAETRPRDKVLRIAIHEAGHAVALMLAGRRPRCLSLVDGAAGGGHVDFVPDLAHGRLSDVQRHVLPILAGRAAEDVLLGEPTVGAKSDLSHAAGVVSALDHAGLGGFLTPAESDTNSVELRMRRLYADAVMLVMQHRSSILDLATLAVEKRVLGETALKEFAQARGLA